MKKKKILLVTGSTGLIGSEIVYELNKEYDLVYGIDNNERSKYFGSQGSTSKIKSFLIKNIKNYKHLDLDISNRKKVFDLIDNIKPNNIVHCAAQPSHDTAARIPIRDFEVNAFSTLNLMEALRKKSKNSSLIYFSTNKVYGDNPNKIKLKEKKKRYDYLQKKYRNGINESFSIDNCLHSLFGASKLSGDIIVQEYGRYFNMKTTCLRGGCLTGPNQSGVEQHGFLNYLVKCNLNRKLYTINGYKGKQVRDNIHSKDITNFVRLFFEYPRIAEVYNIGGGRSNSISILEAIELIEKKTGKKMIYKYRNVPRIGGHICYISDLRKIKKHYPKWEIKYNLTAIIDDLIDGVM